MESIGPLLHGSNRQELEFKACFCVHKPSVLQEASMQHASGQMQQGEATMEVLPPPMEARRVSCNGDHGVASGLRFKV